MDFEENMVDQQNTDAAVDDTLPEGLVEETDASEVSAESFIEDLEDTKPAEDTPNEQAPQGTSEPGWIKKRVNTAVQKAIAAERESIRAEYESQFAPLRERLYEMEAQELVRSGKVKDLETAKELVAYRNGQPKAAPQASPGDDQLRDDKGRYASREDAATSAQISMLQHQADQIKSRGGPDVIAEFQSNEEVRKAVIKGEMDFYDVAEKMKSRKRPPSPSRTPNGANSYGPTTIENMTDEQFARMDKMLDEGVRIGMKR